jgi:hypothetical protein
MFHENKFSVVSKRNTALGYLPYGAKSTVFTFRKIYHAKRVKEWIDIYDYEVMKLKDDMFIMSVGQPRKSRNHDHEIETSGYFDTQVRLEVNNINMFVVDDIIVDDMANIYLLNRGHKLVPIEVNNTLYLAHLEQLYISQSQ